MLASIPANTYSDYKTAFGSLLSYFNSLSFAEQTNSAIVMKDSAGNNHTYYHTAGAGYGLSSMSFVSNNTWQILQRSLSFQWKDFYEVAVTGANNSTPVITCTNKQNDSQDDAIYYYLF